MAEGLAGRPAAPGPDLRLEGAVPRGRRRLRRGPVPEPEAPRGPAPARPAEPQERPDRRGHPPGPVPDGRRPRPANRPGRLARRGPGDRRPAGPPAQVQANRARAIEKLAEAIKGRPDFADAYHLTADIHMLGNDRAKAVAILKEALKVNPDDATALTMAVQILGRVPKDKPASRRQGRPRSGRRPGQGLGRVGRQGGPDARRVQRVLPGQTRSSRPSPGPRRPPRSSTSIAARLNLGDLLLTQSEAQADPAKARQLQDRALGRVRQGPRRPAQRRRGREQQGLDPAQLPRREPEGPRTGPGAAPAGRPEHPARRVLRHPRLDPGGARAGPRTPRSRTRRGWASRPSIPVLNYHMGRLMADRQVEVPQGRRLPQGRPGRQRPAPGRAWPATCPRSSSRSANDRSADELDAGTGRPGPPSRVGPGRRRVRAIDSRAVAMLDSARIVPEPGHRWPELSSHPGSTTTMRRGRPLPHHRPDPGRPGLGRSCASDLHGRRRRRPRPRGRPPGRRPRHHGRPDHDRARPDQGADHGRELPQVCRQGLLRRPGLPPGHPRLHDPGRRDDRRSTARSRRSGRAPSRRSRTSRATA